MSADTLHDETQKPTRRQLRKEGVEVAERDQSIPGDVAERIGKAALNTEPLDMGPLLQDDKAIKDIEAQFANDLSEHRKAHVTIRQDDDVLSIDGRPNTDSIPGITIDTTSIKVSSLDTDAVKIRQEDARRYHDADNDDSLDDTAFAYPPTHTLDVVRDAGQTGAVSGITPRLFEKLIGRGKIKDESLEGSGRVDNPDAPYNPTSDPEVVMPQWVSHESAPAPAAVEAKEENATDDELRKLIFQEFKPKTRRQLRELLEKAKDLGKSNEDIVELLGEGEKAEALEDGVTQSDQPVIDEGVAPPAEEYPNTSHERKEAEQGVVPDQQKRATLRERLGIKGWAAAYAVKDFAADASSAVIRGLRKRIYRKVDTENLSELDREKAMDAARKKVVAVSAVLAGVGVVVTGVLVAKGLIDASHTPSSIGGIEASRPSSIGLGEHSDWTRHTADNLTDTINPLTMPSYEPTVIHPDEGMIEAIQRVNSGMSETDATNLWNSNKEHFLQQYGDTGGWFYEQDGDIRLAQTGAFPQNIQDDFNKLLKK